MTKPTGIKTPDQIAAEAMEAFTIRYDEDVEECSAEFIREQIVAAIEADRAQRPSVNHRPRFEPGERIELVSLYPETITRRPGVVVAIDDEPVIFHALRVRFDDGEERHINPGVLRRIPKEG